MAGTYAASTQVSTAKSREEIERTLRRYGADEFAYLTSKSRAVIAFSAGGRRVRFDMPLPNRDSEEFTLTPSRKWSREESEAEKAWEGACRQKWRALALVIKAKLEAVDAGIVTFEEEFAMHFVLPGGATVAEHVLPSIALAYATGEVPALLPGLDR